MITITEHTNERDRSGGFRNITIARESDGSRCLASLCVLRSLDISLEGDEPTFITTGDIESNHDLGVLMLRLAAELLAHPHTASLPAQDPSPIMFCHEG